MSDHKDYPSLPLRDFIDDIASKSPTPGGGSVAAVAGAMAASLSRMVLEYTVGKPAFAQHDQKLRESLGMLKQAGGRFIALANEDMRAYEAVLASRKAGPAVQEQANLRAIAVPMEMVSLAASVLSRLDDLKAVTNPRLLGDLQASAILVCAAGESAACTVRDNLGSLADPAQASRMEGELQKLRTQSEQYKLAITGYRPGQ